MKWNRNEEERIMNSFVRPFLYASASLLAGSALASGQHHPERHGHHHGVAAPGYDRNTEVTRHCKVESVDQIAPGGCSGCDGGVHLRAMCDGEACDIHLGPATFVEGKKFPLAKGDEIDVTGSRVTYDGGTSLIAREVRKGEAVLELRDDQGMPLWRSQPR
jgi:hypothetical protein